jgi:ribonuclease BN (tRNA processing enzyme)
LKGTERITWRAGEHEARIEMGKAGKAQAAQQASQDEVCLTMALTSSHPLDGAAVYQIAYGGRRLVYATDVEWKERCESEFLEFIRGADVLIHDAQYTSDDYYAAKQGFGHSRVQAATQVAREAEVGTLILFHHEPTYDDDKLDALQAEAQSQFARTYSAYESMEIDLLKDVPTVQMRG